MSMPILAAGDLLERPRRVELRLAQLGERGGAEAGEAPFARAQQGELPAGHVPAQAERPREEGHRQHRVLDLS